jgi:hypothetical protein
MCIENTQKSVIQSTNAINLLHPLLIFKALIFMIMNDAHKYTKCYTTHLVEFE